VITDAVDKDGPYLGNCPSKLQSDNGKEYINEDFQDFCAENGTEFLHGLPYSPWVQGQVD
jgi:transposase InsO family protein